MMGYYIAVGTGDGQGSAKMRLLGARVPSIYSRAERVSDAAVHIAGLVAALIAVPVLITLSALWLGDRGAVFAALVYGVSLIAMLTCSAFYNMTWHPARKDFLRRIDQSAIYIKIAGTYTPFVVLSGGQSSMFLSALWAAALFGVTMILFSPARLKVISIVLYLGIGWAGAVAGGPLIDGLSPTGFGLILMGGSLYTLGLVFFLWETLPFHNTIWHVFVLTASAILYAAVLVEIWGRAALAI